MNKIILFLFTTLIFSQTNVFISEYAETSSSIDRYVEIYNGSDATIDLSDYYLKITRNNGNEYSVSLDDNSNDSNNDGFLDPGNILLIVKSDHVIFFDFDTSNYYNFQYIEWDELRNLTGDDALELFQTLNSGDELIDLIGIPGEDPGLAWEVAGIEDGTKNHTLVRKPNIFEGNINWELSSGLTLADSEWWVYPMDTFYFGGNHYQNYDDINYGCMNDLACNFLEDANTDPDSVFCEFYTCLDCLGIPNGDAVEDECGVCEGPGPIYDCGCNDMPNNDFFCDCDFNTYDCAGVCGGDASIDMCGICDSDTENDCLIDECGVWGGSGAPFEWGCYSDYENVNFIYYWNNGHEADTGLKAYNDIWGYTSPDSTEYALIGSWDGTHIINISNDIPLEVGFIEGAYSGWRDIKTYNNYMYIGTEGAQGIQVVDINNPNNPILVNEWDLITRSHNIMEYNGFLYVIGSPNDINGDGNTSDLIVLDINSDPENPQYIDEWSGQYLHDVCMYDNVLYGCGIMNHTMYAIDISDPANVSLITSWDGIPSAHACWVSEDGNTLFTGSETYGGHIMSWDVTDLSNINLLDQWMPPNGESWSAHNLFIKGQSLYISYYVYGLQILDISDPSNLTRIGYYDTTDEVAQNFGSSDIYRGVWGAFPYYNSNKVVISDRSTGLYVLEFDNNLLGDLNSDGIINVIDIVSIVDIITNELEYSLSADINNDGIVNVVDIIMIVNMILDSASE